MPYISKSGPTKIYREYVYEQTQFHVATSLILDLVIATNLAVDNIFLADFGFAIRDTRLVLALSWRFGLMLV